MTAPIIIDTDQGRILAHTDNGGTILFDVFTDERHLRALVARRGLEHLYPTQLLTGHTADIDAWHLLGRWLINAAVDARVDAENKGGPPPDEPAF